MAAATRSGRQHEGGFSQAQYPSLLLSRLKRGRGRRRQARCVWLTEALVHASLCGCHLNQTSRVITREPINRGDGEFMLYMLDFIDNATTVPCDWQDPDRTRPHAMCEV